MPRSGRGAGGRGGGSSGDFTRELTAMMDSCPTAEALNDRVLQPFIAALEDVCGARGYVMNVYGETANLVFTGDEIKAGEIYAIVEEYLNLVDEEAP